MPFVLSWFMGAGFDKAWRYAIIVPAACLIIVGIALYTTADDCPSGNFRDLERSGERKKVSGASMFALAAKDIRVWIMFLAYGGCFGTELAMNAVLATYFFDYFGLSLQMAGTAASLFG